MVFRLRRLRDQPAAQVHRLGDRGGKADRAKIGREAAHNIGIYSVQTDAAGERSFHYWRDASAARQLFGSADDLAALDGLADRVLAADDPKQASLPAVRPAIIPVPQAA